MLGQRLEDVRQCEPGACAGIWDGSRRYQHARLVNRIGAGFLVTGTGVLLSSLTLHYLNRAERRDNPEAGTADIEFRPLLAPNTTGVSLNLGF
ncbi:hypothetical protein [Haliangium sp.]|uniref:hypothetical protein n=1 Tax=Haliangium sp. TaxID=2663208 RepID=UPI003D0C0673